MKSMLSKYSNKENIHPNIMMASTEEPKPDISRNFPKVSCFGISHQEKDWRKRIQIPSQRETALNNRLQRLLRKSKCSPDKQDKLFTSASNQKHSQRLGNTLLRYLYDRSHSQMNVTFTEDLMSQLLGELHHTVEEIVGTEIMVEGNNPEDLLQKVVEVLREYKSGCSGGSKIGQPVGEDTNPVSN